MWFQPLICLEVERSMLNVRCSCCRLPDSDLSFSVAVLRRLSSVIRHGAMPAKANDDALHLAVCAVHGIPYLLTWNFRHIANAQMRRVLGGVCARAGYAFPTVCTPDELMKGEL